jgi:hypothetical protein
MASDTKTDNYDYKGQAKKWEGPIELSTATTEDINEYCYAKIRQYEHIRATDSELWLFFLDDFSHFARDNFSQIDRTNIKLLQDSLRLGGVYVPPRAKSQSYAQTFTNFIEEEELHIWTEDEFRELLREYTWGEIRSRALMIDMGHITRETPVTKTENVQPTEAKIEPTLQDAPQITPEQTYNQPPHQPKKVGEQVGNKPLREMWKLVKEKDTYSGDGKTEALDYTLRLFKNYCKLSDVPESLYPTAFRGMLRGTAAEHYDNNDLTNRPFQEATNNMKHYFEGPEFNTQTLAQWNITTLPRIMDAPENANKTTLECLRILINKLAKLKYGLAPELRTDGFMYSRIIVACKGVEACKTTLEAPPNGLGPLISRLKTLMIAYEDEQRAPKTRQEPDEAYFTDRRYYYQGDSNKGRDNKTIRASDKPYIRPKSSCFICGKENCRSWKHPQKEQLESRARFAAEEGKRTNGRRPTHTYISAFIATFEGEDYEG